MKQYQQYNSYYEMPLGDFIEKISEELFLNKVNPLILHSYGRENKNNEEVVDICVLYNEVREDFCLLNANTNEFILGIEKDFKGDYFCKPTKLLRVSAFLAATVLAATDIKLYKKSVFNELIIANKLNTEERLDDYKFGLALNLVEELNLDMLKTKLIYYDKDSLIIDGEKEEYINTDLDLEKKIYMLTIYSNRDYMNIVKISENGITMATQINVNDFYYDL